MGIFPEVPDVVWSTINFTILFVGLYFLLFKPISGMMQQREDEVRNNLERAEAEKAEAIQLKADFEAQIGRAQAEAQNIIAKANQAAEKQSDHLIEQAKQEAQGLIDRAEKSIARERDEAIRKLRGEVADLVVAAAGKVIEKSLTAEDHTRLVNEFVAEVEEH